MKGHYTQIKGLSERRRLPRLGKIRLGIKKKSAKTGNEYPAEVEYFVCPPEVQKVYGEKPMELDVLIPVDDSSVFFPTAYKAYGSNMRLKCKGDGETAERYDDKENTWVERSCPCEWLNPEKGQKKQCGPRACLMVILPKVNPGGVYQIDTGSYNSIVDINSGIDYIRALLGRVALVPLRLLREERVTHHEGKKGKHHTLQIRLPDDLASVHKLLGDNKRFTEFLLPAPVDDGPEPINPPAVVNDETGEIIDADHSESSGPELPDKEERLAEIPLPRKPEEKINEEEKVKLWKEFEDQQFDQPSATTFIKGVLKNWKAGKELTVGDYNQLQRSLRDNYYKQHPDAMESGIPF